MSEKDTIPKGQLWVKKRGQLSVPKGNILEVEGTLVVEPETDVEKFERKYGAEFVVQDDKTSHPQSRWSTAKKLQWLGSNRQLICLYEQLVTRELIERTDNWPSLLSAHFLNKDGKNFNLSKQNYQSSRKPKSKPESVKKLQWLGSNRLLIYLYKQLVTRELIERTDNWPSLLSAHFLNKDGKNFNPSNLSKQNYQLYDAKSPRGFKVVDKVLNEVDREAAKNEKD